MSVPNATHTTRYNQLLINTFDQSTCNRYLRDFIVHKQKRNQRLLDNVYNQLHPQAWKDILYDKMSAPQQLEFLAEAKVDNVAALMERGSPVYERQMLKVIAELNEQDSKLLDFINVDTKFDSDQNPLALVNSINLALWNNHIDDINDMVNSTLPYPRSKEEWDIHTKAKNSAPDTYNPLLELLNKAVYLMQNERYKASGSTEDLCEKCIRIRDKKHGPCKNRLV
jgi:hypothetical protein